VFQNGGERSGKVRIADCVPNLHVRLSCCMYAGSGTGVATDCTVVELHIRGAEMGWDVWMEERRM
jgi:hypothetical protein